MIFTNNPNDRGGSKCYYKFAFSDMIFSTLSDVDKSQLVMYTAQMMNSKIKVSFVDFTKNQEQIGVYDEQHNRLYINNLVLLFNMDSSFSYDLYSFIFLTLIKIKKVTKKKKNIKEELTNKNTIKQDNKIDLLLELEQIYNANNIQHRFLVSSIENSILNSYQKEVIEFEKQQELIEDIKKTTTRKM